MTVERIGDPIAYSGFRTGTLIVAAQTDGAAHLPNDRILLALGANGESEGAGLTIDNVDELIARLVEAKQRVLDAADREVLLTAPGAALVKSCLGRWAAYHTFTDGTAGPAEEVEWRDSLEEARADFTERTDIGWCASEEDGGCGAQVNVADLEEPGEDWPKLCPTCYAQAVEDFKAATMEHAEPNGCTWAGTGAETVHNEEGEPACPTCGGVVFEALGEIAKPEVAPC
jgi:hypothetical protein